MASDHVIIQLYNIIRESFFLTGKEFQFYDIFFHFIYFYVQWVEERFLYILI